MASETEGGESTRRPYRVPRADQAKRSVRRFLKKYGPPGARVIWELQEMHPEKPDANRWFPAYREWYVGYVYSDDYPAPSEHRRDPVSWAQAHAFGDGQWAVYRRSSPFEETVDSTFLAGGGGWCFFGVQSLRDSMGHLTHGRPVRTPREGPLGGRRAQTHESQASESELPESPSDPDATLPQNDE